MNQEITIHDKPISLEGTTAQELKVQNSIHPSHIPSLDGVRAFAVSLVLISHCVNQEGISLGVLDSWPISLAIRSGGRFGVFIFFVLSGYLITTLLFREQKKNGRISLYKFWFRRALRIFPVFYLYLAVILCLTLIGKLDVSGDALIAAACYLWNYNFWFINGTVGKDWSVIGHFWTLAVEEHFYLLYPFLFAFLGIKQTWNSLILLVLITPVLTVAFYLWEPASRFQTPIMSHNMFGVSIALGCIFAIAEQTARWSGLRKWLSTPIAASTGLLYGLLLSPMLSSLVGGYWSTLGGEFLVGVSSMSVIAFAISGARTTVVGRFLNGPSIAWFGVISYSTYIWQQLFFHMRIPGLPPLLSSVCMGIIAVCVACLSFYLVERPIMRSRERLWDYISVQRR